MRVSSVTIRNFRRLENVQIDIEEHESIFVGPNNSGKTSASAIFRCFLGGRDFKIHDFSVARMADFDAFITSGDKELLPKVSLDLWFTIDPESIAFGRVFTLLPKLSDFTRVGIRLSYEIDDANKLREHYCAAYPVQEDGNRAKALSQYLAVDGNPVRNTRLKAVDVIVCKRKFPNISIFNPRFLFIAVRKYRNLMRPILPFYTEKYCNLMNLLT